MSRVLARIYDEALHDSALNVTQLAVLRCVDRLAGEPLIRVAEALSMDRTSVYRAVATMERQGWIQVEGGRDARSHRVIVTRSGRSVLDDAAPHWDRIQSEIVEQFGRDRWLMLVEELHALADAARGVEIRRTDR